MALFAPWLHCFLAINYANHHLKMIDGETRTLLVGKTFVQRLMREIVTISVTRWCNMLEEYLENWSLHDPAVLLWSSRGHRLKLLPWMRPAHSLNSYHALSSCHRYFWSTLLCTLASKSTMFIQLVNCKKSTPNYNAHSTEPIVHLSK